MLLEKDKFDVFWEWFRQREKYIFDYIVTDSNKIAEEIATKLHMINDDIAFEISFEIIDGKRNFIVSADGEFELFDLIIQLTNKAPHFERWNIIPFRPRLNQKNQVIEIHGISLDYNDIFFTYFEDDVEDIIHLNVYVNGYDGEDNRYVHTYFILLDSLIGEYDAVTKIGETVMYPMNTEVSVPLFEFKDLIGIVDSLNKTNEIN